MNTFWFGLISELFPTLLQNSGMPCYYKQWFGLVSELFPTLLQNSGIPCYYKQSGRQILWQHSTDIWKPTCSVNDFAPLGLFFLLSILILITFSLSPHHHTFSALSIQVNGIVCSKRHHHRHHLAVPPSIHSAITSCTYTSHSSSSPSHALDPFIVAFFLAAFSLARWSLAILPASRLAS